MNANELADLLKENSALIIELNNTIRQQQEKLTKYELRHVAQRDRIAILEMQHKQQQAEIEAMRNRFTLAFWHDTFVEVKKPNSDLIYRFKLDETNDS